MYATGSFYCDLSGLSANTTYYFRARAIGDISSYGDEKSFNTLAIIPANINLSAILQGSTRPESGWNIPLTIKFFISGNTTPIDVLKTTPVSTFNLIGARSGNVTTVHIPGILPSTYDITVTSPHCLISVKRNVAISGNTTSVNIEALLEGNANNDEKVNIQDFGILAKSYGKQRGQEGFDDYADFDRNDKINITDFGLLAANYGKYSPIEAP